MSETVAVGHATALDDAIRRAVDFLAERQLPDGAFDVLISTDPAMSGDCTSDSSIFPTALAAQALAFAPEADPIRSRALAFLVDQMEPGGLWKHWPRGHPHQHTLPPDMDDTACASAALRLGGLSLPDNRRLILANRARSGLFYTWFTPRWEWNAARGHRRIVWAQLRHPAVLYMFFTRTSARPGDVDAVVNANAVHYLGIGPDTAPVVEHLLEILRSGTESESDKWYENPFAIWYFVARAIGGAMPEAAGLLEDKLTGTRPAHALDAALAACALMYCHRSPGQAAIEALLALQQANGGWPRGALYFGGRLRGKKGAFDPPHPDTPRWGSEELTTAFCLEALARWRTLYGMGHDARLAACSRGETQA